MLKATIFDAFELKKWAAVLPLLLASQAFAADQFGERGGPVVASGPAESWQMGIGGLSAGALLIGNDATNKPSYVCRVSYQGQVIPGKTATIVVNSRLASKLSGASCLFGWYGKQLTNNEARTSYEALILSPNSVVKWQPWNGGQDWDIGTGIVNSGYKMYVAGQINNVQAGVCRANSNGVVSGGNFINGRCMVTDQGKEVAVDATDVLGIAVAPVRPGDGY